MPSPLRPRGQATSFSSTTPHRSRLLVEALEDRAVPASFVDVGVNMPGVRQSDIAWADYDNDGNLDFAVTGSAVINYQSTNITRIYHNDGNGAFSDAGISLPSTGFLSFNWVDYDNDHWMDLSINTVTNVGNEIAKIYHNNQDGSFSEIATPLPQIPGKIAWGDYDNDGLKDIAFASGSYDPSSPIKPSVKIYHNDGDGAFTQIATELPAAGPVDVSWVDYDNDGRLDLSVDGSGYSYYWQNTTIYRNSADGVFDATGIELPGVSGGAIAWGDYDNDHLPDALIIGFNEDLRAVARLYHNNGDGSFTEIDIDVPGGSYDGDAAWADFDNDGDLDFVVAASTGRYEVNSSYTRVYRNDGGVFSLFTDLKGVVESGVDWGDFNNDGYADLAVGGVTNYMFATKIYRYDPDALFIRGALFRDIDANGELDENLTGGAGETIFPGVTVYIDANNNGFLDPGETSTITDNIGDFALPATPGTHTVRVESTFTVSSPASRSKTVTMGDTDAVFVHFGIAPKPVIVQIYNPYQFERQGGDTPEQAILRALYATLLDRVVDVTSEMLWTKQLKAGMTVQELTLAIARSEEFALKQVDAYYRSLLGRPAVGDPAAGAWVLMIQKGADGQSIVPYIIGSEEYRQRSQSPEEFVDSVYVTVLGREADGAGQVGWLSSLQLTGDYYSVAKGVALSRESCEQIVRTFYTVFLQREADTSAWVDLLVQGKITVAELRLAFLNSSEFFDKVTR